MSRVLPILFNTEMVRAILDGRKTVTRRVIKNLDIEENNGMITLYEKGEDDAFYVSPIGDAKKEMLFYSSYQPGDILYVRETWCNANKAGVEPDYYYLADTYICEDYDKTEWKWRPSIHMPKEAARIWLKVTDVRVERLQEITEEQAIREGIVRIYDNLSDAEYIAWSKRAGVYPKAKADWGYKNYLWHGNFGTCGTGNKMSDAWEYQYSSYDSAIDSFSSLWNTTVPLKEWDIYGWTASPWVWVIEFERCEKPAPCILKGMEPASDKRPCIGYQKSQDDDEPCEMCKECKWCDGEEPEGQS